MRAAFVRVLGVPPRVIANILHRPERDSHDIAENEAVALPVLPKH